jgi:hypothetical protein
VGQSFTKQTEIYCKNDNKNRNNYVSKEIKLKLNSKQSALFCQMLKFNAQTSELVLMFSVQRAVSFEGNCVSPQ